MDINRCLYDLQLNKTVSSKITDNKTWEKNDFNADQQQVRRGAATQFENIITNRMTTIVRKVQNDVL